MQGSCHCGAVRIELSRPPDWVGECNCSICRRTAGRWAYYPAAEVRIETDGDGTDGYIWGDKCLALHHCRRCGCTTHWRSLDPDYDRMGVNIRMFDGFDAEGTEIRQIDGASF